MLARAFAVTLLALAAVGCTGSETRSSATFASGNVVELTSVATLKSAFAEGEGKARLLLVLSPT